jgi:uncharacterized protein (DUF169 family)
MSLRPLTHDLSIFNKLQLERSPVAIKYEFFEPEGVEQLDRSLALCEMVKEASQRDKPFFISRDNEECAGKCALGMMEGPVWGEAGEIGERMDLFQDGRANRHCTTHYKTFKPGTINYAVYSRLELLKFEPDLLVFVGPVEQVEPVLRAMTYSTGEMYQSKSTIVFQCSWLYTYPVITQEINYVITGMSFGMKAREVYPDGLAIVSVPWNWIPTIAENLKEMKLVPHAWTLGREAWKKEETNILVTVGKKADEMKVKERSFIAFQEK